MNIFIIYKTINLINDHYYIGKHKQKVNFTPYEFDGYLGSGERLKKAKKIYGKENFKRVTLYWSANEDEIFKLEEKIIGDKWKSNFSDCYNMSPGGSGAQSNHLDGVKRIPHSQETKNKISKANKGRKLTLEHKEQISKRLKGRKTWNKGLSHSFETKQKISLATKGKNNPMYGKSVNKGKVWCNNGEITKMFLIHCIPKEFVIGRLALGANRTVK